MSNTRRAEANAPLSQERYMSSPEYAELRGLSGTAVAAKASLLTSARKRSLLFFIQALSLQSGGVKKIAKDLLAMFPERLGTQTMHKAGVKPGTIYSSSIAQAVEEDLGQPGRWDYLKDEPAPPRAAGPVEEFLEKCSMEAEQLDKFLIELCINPTLEIQLPGEPDYFDEIDREKIDSHFDRSGCFEPAAVPYFKDIIGALLEFQKRHTEAARREFVMTGVAETVFDTLDFALETGKMVVLEGNSRIGKTTAVEAWGNQHLGQARIVSLSGISNRSGVFQAIAKCVGVACSDGYTTTKVQAHVQDVLQRSRLMLVIDEAHFLFGQAERVYSRPELVDWVNTALYNHRVPVALVCTPQFGYQMAKTEKQTGWNAEQFRGRVKRYVRLPEVPSKADLESVARKCLPDADKPSIKFVVGYAQASKRHFPAVVDAIDDARFIAKRAGRERVTFEDLEKAITDFRIPSDEAQSRTLESFESAKRRPGKRQEVRIPTPPPAPSSASRAFNSAELHQTEPSRRFTAETDLALANQD